MNKKAAKTIYKVIAAMYENLLEAPILHDMPAIEFIEKAMIKAKERVDGQETT